MIPVSAWTDVGSARLRNAQDKLGLTNGQTARQIGLSEKQWRRWRDEGRVRTAAVPTVERVLQIEIPREPVPAPTGGPLAELEAAALETVRRQRRILLQLDGIDERLDDVLSHLRRIERQTAPPAVESARREPDSLSGSPP